MFLWGSPAVRMGRAAAIFGDPLTSPSHRFACLHRRSAGLRTRRAGLAGFLRHLLIVVILALSAEVGVASESSVRFIGPLADHLLDRSGRLMIDDVAPPNSPHDKFSDMTADRPDYGPSPSPTWRSGCGW